MVDSSHGEAALVEHAIAGDTDAFGELYLLHLDAIYRYVYFRVGDVHDAEDLTEQVFLKAWEALPGYRHCGNRFSSWLYRIAHNIVIDHCRHRSQLSLPLADRGDEGSSQVAALDRVIEAEEAAALVKAVAQLPDDQQQVIILRFVEGLSHNEVAHIMDKSEGACRVMQHRTLAALNELLANMQGK